MSGLLLLLKLIGASLRSQAQYPTSAIVLTVGQFFATAVEIVAVWALFDRFGAVDGWQFGEVAVFYGLVHVMFAIADVLSRGFEVLGTDLVRTGEFDRLLLRPRALALQLIGHEFRISRTGRLAQALIVLFVGAQAVDVTWSVGIIALTVWTITGGIALFFGLLVLQGTLSFWTIQSLEVTNVLTYGGVQAAQFPLSIYDSWLRGVLTFVVPLACVAYFPVVRILGHADPLDSPAWLAPITPAAGFLMLGLALLAWRSGVRHYTSTGS
jgi:ABC-2 type transport system permease protein